MFSCNFWFFFCLVVGSSIGPGESLECYTCSSSNGHMSMQSDCDRFNFYEMHKKSQCMPGEICAKTVVNHDGMIWVHRSCRPSDICGYLTSIDRRGSDRLLECSTCSDRDLCNSATVYTNNLLIVLVALVMISFYSLFRN